MLSQLQSWALELGFSQIGVTDIQLSDAEDGLQAWLEAGFHGEMDYMQRHGLKEQDQCNEVLVKWARKYNVKIGRAHV